MIFCYSRNISPENISPDRNAKITMRFVIMSKYDELIVRELKAGANGNANSPVNLRAISIQWDNATKIMHLTSFGAKCVTLYNIEMIFKLNIINYPKIGLIVTQILVTKNILIYD
jgi:hypothetical protein